MFARGFTNEASGSAQHFRQLRAGIFCAHKRLSKLEGTYKLAATISTNSAEKSGLVGVTARLLEQFSIKRAAV